ncbi:MAG: DNA-processing protein DprA [Dermatophilaceae bacterium]
MSSLPAVLEDERLARAAWSRVSEPGDVRAAGLVARFGPVEALRAVFERGHDALEPFVARIGGLDVERDLYVAGRVGGRVLMPGDPEWPTGCDDLQAPPICLWVRGPARLALLRHRSVSMVGARASSRYGDQIASQLAAELGQREFVVVSGAAYGIDAASHRGALAVAATTVAVLAGGVDRAYPAGNSELIERIAAEGAVVSEVAPSSAPTRSRFLTRNRLIATMTAGTVVVEAGLRSGSLNTARTAAEYARPVGVVPGPVTSMTSAGCHQACRDGYAVLVTDVDEVIELMGAYGSDASPRPTGPVRPEDRVDAVGRAVLAALPVRKAIDVATLARNAGVTLTQTIASLGRLELAGVATRDGECWRQVARRGI